MEAIDLAHKLAYAGARSPVPFFTGPEYTNSVPGVPVLSMLRIFLKPAQWSESNVMLVAREVARVLGPTEQFDIGVTLTNHVYDSTMRAQGVLARLMKLDAGSAELVLRIADDIGDRMYRASFPRLQFEPAQEDFWQSLFTTGAVKPASLQ